MLEANKNFDFVWIGKEANRLAKEAGTIEEIKAIENPVLRRYLCYFASAECEREDPQKSALLNLEYYREAPKETVSAGEAHNWAGTVVKAQARKAITPQQAQAEVARILSEHPEFREDVVDALLNPPENGLGIKEGWTQWLEGREGLEGIKM